MKNILMISIFVFLTGLFAGLFFSTGISADNNSLLSAQLLDSISSSDAGFGSVFIHSLLANVPLLLIMLPAVFSKYLCPLPQAVLFFKSFAIGFCSGLIYANASSDAFLISFIRIVPQNLFYIPAFIIICTFASCISLGTTDIRSKKNRGRKSGAPLYIIPVAAFSLAAAGALTEAVFHLIAL